MDYLKMAAGAIGTFVSWLIGGTGLAAAILLGLMLVDYATGLMVAYKSKELNSRLGLYGLKGSIEYQWDFWRWCNDSLLHQ